MANPENAADNFLNASKSPRLLEAVRDTIRLKHYSLRTEETYVHWIRRFIHFHGKRHPPELGATEVTAFLNHLVKNRDVAATTQNQALSALLFLYREVLAEPLAWLDGVERAKRPARVPTVLSTAEIAALLSRMTGTKWLMASLLYGAGLRLRGDCTGSAAGLEKNRQRRVVADRVNPHQSLSAVVRGRTGSATVVRGDEPARSGARRRRRRNPVRLMAGIILAKRKSPVYFRTTAA